MSYCTSASCLAHRRAVFIQLWPGSGAPYPWVHTDLSPCDGIPRATAEQAGEVCACGHHRHEAAPGPIPHGKLANPRPCAECPCPDFAHPWQRAAVPDPSPRWIALLKCGHTAPMPGRPEPGQYWTCLECQGQQRVLSVTPVPAGFGVPGPGEAGVQEPLWDEAALPVAAISEAA